MPSQVNHIEFTCYTLSFKRRKVDYFVHIFGIVQKYYCGAASK